jgi:hypothetical protein
MNQDHITRLMGESIALGLSELRGHSVDVQSVVRAPFEGSSSFPTERLRVLANDQWINVFFKDLNPFHQLIEARNIRETALERSRREIHVYKSLLQGGYLGTPEFYGSRWEPAKGLLWLFMEDVGPKRLSRLGDLSLWTAAARWAARFHAKSRGLPPQALSRLPQHDATHYERCADQLEVNLGKFPAEHRQKVFSAIRLYRGVIDQLRSLPHGLIHNEYFGKNIVIRPEPATERIAVIDWETAAIGLNYLDLSNISAGRWTLEQRLQMWRGYFEQAEIESGASLNWRTFCDDLHSVALYQSLYWLNWWSSGDDVHIQRWLVELDRVLSTYGRSAPAGVFSSTTHDGPLVQGGVE